MWIVCGTLRGQKRASDFLGLCLEHCVVGAGSKVLSTPTAPSSLFPLPTWLWLSDTVDLGSEGVGEVEVIKWLLHIGLLDRW